MQLVLSCTRRELDCEREWEMSGRRITVKEDKLTILLFIIKCHTILCKMCLLVKHYFYTKSGFPQLNLLRLLLPFLPGNHSSYVIPSILNNSASFEVRHNIFLFSNNRHSIVLFVGDEQDNCKGIKTCNFNIYYKVSSN